MEDAPDIAGQDVHAAALDALGIDREDHEAAVAEAVAGQDPDGVAQAEQVASDDGMPEAPPWIAEGREPTTEEKLDVLAGTIEYHDGQIAEIREACSQMARVLVRLVQAVDGATGPAKVYGPDGTPLNRKQRRDIAFGRTS